MNCNSQAAERRSPSAALPRSRDTEQGAASAAFLPCAGGLCALRQGSLSGPRAPFTPVISNSRSTSNCDIGGGLKRAHALTRAGRVRSARSGERVSRIRRARAAQSAEAEASPEPPFTIRAWLRTNHVHTLKSGLCLLLKSKAAALRVGRSPMQSLPLPRFAIAARGRRRGGAFPPLRVSAERGTIRPPDLIRGMVVGVTMNRKWRRNPLKRLKMDSEMAEGRSRSRA